MTSAMMAGVLIFVTPNVWAQTATVAPAEQLSATIRSLEAQVVDLKSESRELRSLLGRLLALQEQERVQASLQGPEGKQRAREAAKATQPEAEVASKLVGQLSPDVVGKELKDSLQRCVDGLKNESVKRLQSMEGGGGAPPTGTAENFGCAPQEAQKLRDDLERVRSEALEKWKNCRATIIQARPHTAVQLPEDPSGLTDSSRADVAANLQEIKRQTTTLQADAKRCLDELERSYEQVTQAEDATAALASALSFAAQVCFASGGNVYVCGAMLLVALVMSFTGGGSGKGKGEGKGDGKADGKTGREPRPTTGPVTAGGPPARAPTVAPLPVANFGSNVQGGAQCRRGSGDTLTCWRNEKPEPQVTLDPANTEAKDGLLGAGIEVFRDIIRRPGQADRLVLCGGDAQHPFGSVALVVVGPEGNRVQRIALDYTGGKSDRPKLVPFGAPTPLAAIPPAPADACGR